MNGRERVELSLQHKEPDSIPLDLGGSVVSGMHVSSVYQLRQALELDDVGTPVKVIEPFQMLGEIGTDLMDVLEIDVVSLDSPKTMFGFKKENWKEWRLFDGTPVLVPGLFHTQAQEDGSILLYPEGDVEAPPSGKMPKDGFYFDSIIRQRPIDDEKLNVEDNVEEFGPVSQEDLQYFERESKRLYEEGRAIFANFGGTSFGDIALVPAPQRKDPRGIRDIEEWYISTITRQEYIYEVFERQCTIALENLKSFSEVVGDRVSVVFISGTDFGMQEGPFVSPLMYRELFMPFHKKINHWVHTHTNWKTFIHSCGSVLELIPLFIESGFDILNPVQFSASKMDPLKIKEEFGDRISFWGGGVDTQKTLPFGTPEEIEEEVRERIKILGPNGGFVFNTIHNVQAKIPIENLRALFETFITFRSYPLDR